MRILILLLILFTLTIILAVLKPEEPSINLLEIGNMYSCFPTATGTSCVLINNK